MCSCYIEDTVSDTAMYTKTYDTISIIKMFNPVNLKENIFYLKNKANDRWTKGWGLVWNVPIPYILLHLPSPFCPINAIWLFFFPLQNMTFYKLNTR